MKIVVLAGGLSTERQVSLTSGTGVCRALRERGHQAILVDMFLGLEDYNGSLADIFDAPDGLCGDNRVHSTEPDLEAVRRSRRDQGPSMLGKDVLAVCAMADLVFLALHGSCGEDGRIQATLDLGVYSRADFILDEEGSFWCLEINTLPGMTPTSLVPQEAAQVGLSYGDLCQRIVDESLALRKGGRA